MKIPTATYRLQFHPEFGLEDAKKLVPYLKSLGISDLYSSPLCQPTTGSTHGYDVINPERLNPALGTEDDLQELSDTLNEHSMGLLLDIVPNHMAANEENHWWKSVLEQGLQSQYASYFDIDWSPLSPYMKNKVLLPLLGGHIGHVLENGQLKLILHYGNFSVAYYDRRFPLNLQSYTTILEYNVEAFVQHHGPGHPATRELISIIESFKSLGGYQDSPETVPSERDDPIGNAKNQLNHAYENYSEIKEYIDDTLRMINGQEKIRGSFDSFEEVLQQQYYRLSFWKIANEEINYRRFFNISDLICLRVENDAVFEHTHALIFKWIAQGIVTGLRIDHIDGLFDPLGYLENLQETIAKRLHTQNESFYVIVEKILCEDENLPTDWNVSGTTGYDFMTELGGVFIDHEGLHQLTEFYRWIMGRGHNFHDMVYEKKKLVMDRLFAGEIRLLETRLKELAQDDRHARDLSTSQLSRALVETTACMPIYRNYSRDFYVSPRDQFYVDYAIKEAKRRTPAVNSAALLFLKRVFMLELPSTIDVEGKVRWHNFVMRWQQFTGPLMAKGLEDTTLYIYNRLVSLNDVGGEPDAEQLSVEAFHQHNLRRMDHWPNSMNATSTHDTKRSEDVRARLHVLSEMVEPFQSHLRKWFEWNTFKRKRIRRLMVPSRNEEYLLYQTLLGFWPNEEANKEEIISRLKEYIIKATREAKVYTSWMRPDAAYENALTEFIDAIMDDSHHNEFLNDFLTFQKEVAFYGAWNGLSQVLLKSFSPGVPDFYQGTELWDYSLVDPDNRRPVDFDKRIALLQELQQKEKESLPSLLEDLLSTWGDGRIKLWLTYKCLQVRKQHPEIMKKGTYVPLSAQGERANHVMGFARIFEGKWIVVVIPRLLTKFLATGQPPMGEEVWGNTRLLCPAKISGDALSMFTDETFQFQEENNGKRSLSIKDVFGKFPMGLLTSA